MKSNDFVPIVSVGKTWGSEMTKVEHATARPTSGEEHHIFVPGRLALFGEHSDWAGGMRKCAMLSARAEANYVLMQKFCI